MTQPGLVYAHALAPPDLFWRITAVVVMFVGVLLGVTLAVGPLILLGVYRNLWLLLLLPLVAAGVWMVTKVLGHWHTLRWHYTHLPRATLYSDRIESLEWPTPFRTGAKGVVGEEPRRRTIPLDAVTSAVVSFAIVRRTLTPRGIPITETAPVVYVIYDDGGSQDLLSVPFSSHKDEGVNRWLSHFASAGIPLQYTARILFRHDTQVLTDADRLKHLNLAKDVIPYTFSDGWLPDEQELAARWAEVDRSIRREEEARDPELKEKRSRHSARTWISMGLIFIWLGIIVIFQQLAATNWYLDPANPLISFLCVVAFGFAFFHRLRSHLRWPYMFIYSGGVLISAIFVLIPSRPGVELDVSSGFLLAALAYQPLCWLPYLVVKKVAAKFAVREEAQEDPKVPA